MRILLFVLMTGCCLVNSNPDATTDDATDIPVLEASPNPFFDLTPDYSTPPPVPISEMPDPHVYPIATRVIIEGQPVGIGDGETLWWSRTLDEVRRDLKNAEEIYKDIGLKFIVKEISFQEFNPDVIQHFVMANVHRGVLTIRYMLPNGFAWEGYTSGPWEPINRGVIINYLANEWTLAHEIGHYFGLLHTFDEDFVDDTPEQKGRYCAGKENTTKNCCNIMNYCDHTPKTLTKGQKERLKRFLRSKRIDHFDRDRTDLLTENGGIIVK